MYCKNCGKQTSDEASFCPYCGEKIAENIQINNKETVNPASNVSDYIENEDDVPIYKRKNKVALLVGFIPLIYAICYLAVVCGMIFTQA